MHSNIYPVFPFFKSIKAAFVQAGNQVPLPITITLIFLIIILGGAWIAYDIGQKKSVKDTK